jgi:hypothetical protein
MRRDGRSISEFVCLAALICAAAAAHAATASGKLMHANGSPAAGVTVTLSNERGRSAPAQSDASGAYTLPNIPAGQYYLEVWANPKTPQTVEVTVSEPATSLPLVKVP